MTSSCGQRWRACAAGSRGYELSPDLRDKQVEMLCRKYGGAAAASRAARVIQTAYRRYRLSRSFARIRLEAAGETRLSRCLDAGAAGSAVVETRVFGGGVCCRVRACDVRLTDGHGRAVDDTLRWIAATSRHVQKTHSVSVTTTTTRHHHHHHHHHRDGKAAAVRPGCCAADPDTSSLAEDPAGLRPAARSPAVVVHRHERRPLPVNASSAAPPSDDDEVSYFALSYLAVSYTHLTLPTILRV